MNTNFHQIKNTQLLNNVQTYNDNQLWKQLVNQTSTIFVNKNSQQLFKSIVLKCEQKYMLIKWDCFVNFFRYAVMGWGERRSSIPNSLPIVRTPQYSEGNQFPLTKAGQATSEDEVPHESPKGESILASQTLFAYPITNCFFFYKHHSPSQ